VTVPSDDTATIELPSVPIIRAANGPVIANPEGIGPADCPSASIKIPESLPSLSNAMRSGMNDAGVGVGEGAATVGALVGEGVTEDTGADVGDAFGEGVAAPQAARAAALAITSAARWIRIDSFISCL
jgi:hypothetical protein